MLHALPAFADNYIWALESPAGVWVVDPGDAAPVEAFLARHGLPLAGLLITHHHGDHTGGIATLAGATTIPVYGPAHSVAGITNNVSAGDVLELPGLGQVKVIGTPGHTTDHLAYFLPDQGLLFCGDTLFSAGCGRLFEGSAAQLHDSLSQLSTLPGSTQVCCAHEYTLANLRFAAAVEPENIAIASHLEQVIAWRAAGLSSLPSRLADELRWNPFLRCRTPAVIAAASQHAGHPLQAGEETFAELRRWKDGFRA